MTGKRPADQPPVTGSQTRTAPSSPAEAIQVRPPGPPVPGTAHTLRTPPA